MSTSGTGPFPLKDRRVHEASGPGSATFGAALWASLQGKAIWICETWHDSQLNPLGLCPFADPKDLLLVRVKDQDEALAVAEEALRGAAVALVVVELRAAPSFTAGRRLQLAAETGKTAGLCLIPEGAGCNAAETRWHCAPVFDPDDSTLHRWTLIKNKTGTLGAWDVRWDTAARRLHVVSPAGKRPGSENLSD